MSDEARRGAGGAAQAALRASSEDRKPVGAGSPPPAAAAEAAHKIQLKSADMKEEMRQEAFEIARIVRTACLRSCSSSFLLLIWFSLRRRPPY
jgi:dynein light chain LC8-type